MVQIDKSSKDNIQNDTIYKKLMYKFNISDNNELKYSCIALLILLVVIYFNAFENNNYTCNNILVNTYLYVLVSLLIFHIMILYFVKINVHINFLKILTKYNRFIVLFGILILLIGLLYIFQNYSNNIIISHIILLILISFFSVLISLTYVLLKKYNIYNKVIYSTILLVVVLLVIFYFKHDLVKQYLSPEYSYIFLILLVVVILVKIIYFIFIGYSKNISTLISLIILVIFGYLLLADTQKILNITPRNCKYALKHCTNNIYNSKCIIDNYPSYPQKSFDIFHDIIVIFQYIANLFLSSQVN